MIGSDRWLFYTDDNAFDDYRSRTMFTPKELAAWKRILEQRRDWLAAHGSHYLVVLVPDKHVVYGEHIPRSIRRVGEEYASEQLAAYLRKNTMLEVLNLAPALERAKHDERIYHRTDTHWNDRGALIGYQEIIRRLTPRFPAVWPLERPDFDALESRTPGWDPAEMLKLGDASPEDNLSLRPRVPRTAKFINGATHDERWNDPVVILEKDDPTLPRAVMLRDSFASALVPFLAEHFSHLFVVWDQGFYVNVMERGKPDVMIQEIAGRKLIQFSLYNPPELEPTAATTEASGEHP
jgi:alginate O-acetyltransferase complex protein AlgJ